MSKDTDLIKDRLDVVDVLRSYLTLSPAGRNFKALCPFHPEKTPSFIVSPERKSWHCFGCGIGGDVISFVMRYENLEFPEALRMLAERAGIEIQSMNPREQRELEALYGIHEEATKFFSDILKVTSRARDYLKSRTLTPETQEAFRLGFASGGEALTLHLLKRGYDINDIVRAGLTHKNTIGLYRDRFQDRIIFPITNNIGKVVAFTGRLVPSPQSSAAQGDIPKYVNSPETPIFNKSKVLFGLSSAKNYIAETRAVVIMEGQMDFLLAWQSGVKNVVAVSGTGFSDYQLERIRRLADVVLLSFDNDEAGFKALERGLDLFSRYDFHVQAIDLGIYKDPGEACEKDPQFLSQAIMAAKPAFTYIFDRYLARAGTAGTVAKKQVIRDLLLKITSLKSSVEQDVWIKELANRSGISEVALLSEAEHLPASSRAEEEQSKSHGAEPSESKNPSGGRIDMLATRLLAVAFTNSEFLSIVKANKNMLPEKYVQACEDPASDAHALFDMEASMFSDNDPKVIREEFDALLTQLKMEFLRNEQARLGKLLKDADGKGDDSSIAEIAKQFTSVSQQLHKLHK